MADPLELPVEGVQPKPGDKDLSDLNISKLYDVARMVTDDLARQTELVALAVIAGWDHAEFRRRAGIVPEAGRPLPTAVRSHSPSMSGKVRSHSPNTAGRDMR